METQTTTTTTPTAPARVRKPAKRVTKPATKVAKPATTTPKGKTALKSICSSLKIDPKAARRLLRKSELSFHGAKERWVFTDAQAEKVRELLKGSEIERDTAKK